MTYDPDVNTILSDERLRGMIAHSKLVGPNSTPSIVTGELRSLATELLTRRAAQPSIEALKLSAALKLWREHGGSTYGPHVEHVSMKESDFLGFCQALTAEGAKS